MNRRFKDTLTEFFSIAMQGDNTPRKGNTPRQQRVIIVGATSGIGRALAEAMYHAGYIVAATGRRTALLESLRNELNGQIVIREMDVSRVAEARDILLQLIEELSGVDIIVLNAGVGYSWPSYAEDMQMVQINCAGFVGLADIAVDHFVSQEHGHLVGVSSVMARRGMFVATTYSATKAFIASYLQGIQHRMRRKGLNVDVTEICPGFVLTHMTERNTRMFGEINAQQAARQILRAIRAKRSVAYIPEKWRLIAFLLQIVPRWVSRYV